uniref:Uncharacterized protein n=1 Tax=Cacopsylla melanoneura TaxID=428564 RepID=A0A8D8UBR6_9HEMI
MVTEWSKAHVSQNRSATVRSREFESQPRKQSFKILSTLNYPLTQVIPDCGVAILHFTVVLPVYFVYVCMRFNKQTLPPWYEYGNFVLTPRRHYLCGQEFRDCSVNTLDSWSITEVYRRRAWMVHGRVTARPGIMFS